MNEELMSRRAFFKKAISKTLPILAGVAFGPTLLAACDKDDPNFYMFF